MYRDSTKSVLGPSRVCVWHPTWNLYNFYSSWSQLYLSHPNHYFTPINFCFEISRPEAPIWVLKFYWYSWFSCLPWNRRSPIQGWSNQCPFSFGRVLAQVDPKFITRQAACYFVSKLWHFVPVGRFDLNRSLAHYPQELPISLHFQAHFLYCPPET